MAGHEEQYLSTAFDEANVTFCMQQASKLCGETPNQSSKEDMVEVYKHRSFPSTKGVSVQPHNLKNKISIISFLKMRLNSFIESLNTLPSLSSLSM
jgi:hypothetical protein